MLALVVVAAGPALAQDPPAQMPEPEPGYPPKMGAISGLYGDKPVAWETYDFSVGAFDASAWAMTQDGNVALRMMAYPPGEPQEMRQRIHITADFGKALRKGAGQNVVINIYKDRDIDGPRLTSVGQTASLTVTRAVGAPNGGSGYGSVAGAAVARICPVDWPTLQCQDISLSFDTAVQYDGQVAVK